MRATSQFLQSRVDTLNMILERPASLFTPNPQSGSVLFIRNVGHLALDKDSTGYQLVEIISTSGGEVNWSNRLTSKEMNLFLDGLVRGISLRNAHIGVVLVKNELMQAGLTPVAALYDDANVSELRALKVAV